MGNSAAFRDLGHLSEQRGDLTNAERAYRQAADMGNSAARRDLTQLLERTGDSRRPDPLAEPAYPDRAESSGTTTIEADLRDEALGEVSDRSAAQLFGRLSPSSISALEYADALRIAARRDKIHMEHLLLGLSQKQDGPTRRLLERAGLGQAELLDVLAEAVGASFPPSIAPSHLDSLPPISKHAAEALERAVGLADSLDSQVVRSRHLFYGTLSVSGCSVVRLLAARGVRAADIENLATSGPPIAIADRPSLLPGAAADTVPEPGSGRVKSADKLDVAVDVEMLVSVLLARDTPLPLAVGLFGDWGSGKSFFMALMQERIDELAKLAKDRQPQAWPYCQEIRQVRFNAWHYVDTDLWASLAATLFDELARAGQADETQAKLKELDQARKKVVEARAERHRLEREVAELDAKVNRPIAAARAAVSAAIRAVRDEEKVSAKLRDVALADSPLDDSSPPRADDDSITQLADVLGVVDGPLGRAQVTWRLCKEEVLHRRRRTTIVTFAALILVAVIATMLTKWSAGATLLAVLGAAIAALTPALNGGLRVLYWAREAREARELPLVEKRGELAIARAAESAAEEEALQGKQELANARNKGLRLQELVRERAASSDYRDRLGVMSRVRRDFEDLVGLMPGGQPNGTDDGEDPDVGTRVAPQVPDVERIFLYVDDLDRCPHDKVVEVLQAVHLLLAFKLFVVVVGVDSRWLTRSLAAHYDNLLDEPDSYLEKIFQIPFALRRMTQQRYQDLIVALTPPPSPARETTDSHGTVVPPPEDAIEPSRIASVSQESPDKSYEVDNSEVEANPSGSAADPQADAHPTPPIEPETSEPALPRPEALSLTAPERSLLGQVSDFVPTPRAAKRLVNIYRMLRVSVPSDELEAFLPKTDSEVDRDGNEYQAVILLLGILIGRPAVSQHVFNSLTAAPPSTDIWQLLAPFEELNEPLRRLREHVTVGRIDAYQRWAPRVSRFSFRMAVVPP
ncbi:P-loop NTPase fold protein [Kribbella sp. NPDC049227]|uniref:P-loop NTPase fold protein n=1 Tax=Kribbella sp. NPDC049227 TaxID=3364113 RepID=UPI00371FEFA1